MQENNSFLEKLKKEITEMGMSSEEFFFPEVSYYGVKNIFPEGFIFPIAFGLSLSSILGKEKDSYLLQLKEYEKDIQEIKQITNKKINFNDVFYLDFPNEFHDEFLIKEVNFNEKVQFIFNAMKINYNQGNISKKEFLEFLKGSLPFYNLLNNPFEIRLYNSKEDIEEFLEKMGINNKHDTLKEAQEEIYKLFYNVILKNYKSLIDKEKDNKSNLFDLEDILKNINLKNQNEKIKIGISAEYIFSSISEIYIEKNKDLVDNLIEYLQLAINLSYFSNLEKNINYIKANYYIENLLKEKKDENLIKKLSEDTMKLKTKSEIIIKENLEYKKLVDLMYMSLDSLCLATDKLEEAYTFEDLEKVASIKENINKNYKIIYNLYKDLIDFDIFINDCDYEKYFEKTEQKIKDITSNISNIKIEEN